MQDKNKQTKYKKTKTTTKTVPGPAATSWLQLVPSSSVRPKDFGYTKG